MSTDQMLWMILQDRRRQAADAARERLATRLPDDGRAPDATRRPAADHRTLRPAEGAPGR
jgi:hypothetical protein